jgi:hypothetical protein
MAATSEAEEEVVTGRGLKTGAVGLRGWSVVKSTIGMVESGIEVLLVFSWENGIGDSAMAPAGYS